MKITDVKIQALQVPLAKPLHISLGMVTDAISALVTIETDEGITGYGEGSPGVLITGENLPGTMESLKVFRTKLIGMDPLDLEAVSVMMNRETSLAGAAKCAIDLACHDILGRKAGLPLYKLLGGQSNRIVTDMTVGIDEPEVMAEKARGYVEEGFDTIKTKVGTVPALDIARVKAIREAVGDHVKIRLDANQGWHAKEAVNIISRLNEYDIELVEQPVRRSDFEGLIYVTANSPVPIMADESCWDSKDAIQLISRRAVDASLLAKHLALLFGIPVHLLQLLVLRR